MNEEFFSDGMSDRNSEPGRKELADEIRISLWPHVSSVRRLINKWVAEHRSPIDLLPLPSRQLTLAEKCASLAAFHDSVEEGEPFWLVPDVEQATNDPASQSARIAHLIKITPWTALISAARDVNPRPHDPLRSLLPQVVKALKDDSSETPQQSAAPHRLASVTDANEDAADRWPNESTLIAICEQTRKFCELIRDLLPTTAGRPPFSGNAIPTVLTELDRLTYLFYGRTLAEFDADREHSARLGWWISIAGWIVATPGPSEHPALRDQLVHKPRLFVIANSRHWSNPVPVYVDSIYHGLEILRVYFGQIVFSRNEWIGAGNWLRNEVSSHIGSLACHPQAQLGSWFDGEVCRMPRYLVRKPELFCSQAELREPNPVPSEIDRCGTHDNPKTDGLPIEWIESMERFAQRLLSAVNDQCKLAPASSRRLTATGASSSLGHTNAVSLQTGIDSQPRSGNETALAQFKRLLVDEIFSQAWSISEKLKIATNYGPETYDTFKSQWDRLRDGLNRAGEHLDAFPTAVRVAVENLALIVNRAAGGISFADVCKSLAESQLGLWADKGWRAYKTTTDPPVIVWSQSAQSGNHTHHTQLSEPPVPLVGWSIDGQRLKSFTRVRERFSAGAENHRLLSALLVHSVQLCYHKSPDWPDGFESQGCYRLNIRGGPMSEPRQLFDEEGRPAIGMEPLPDKDGNPIVLGNGSPPAMWPGGRRTYSLCGSQFPGSSALDYSSACAEYMDIAADAGRIIDDLPGRAKQVIWRDWPHGFIKPDASDLWTNAVFELAWQDQAGSGLAADRWTWLANKKLKIGDVARTQETPLNKLFAELIERAGDPPRYWYSWLSNIWRASVAAIDILESLLNRPLADESNSRPEVGDKTTGPGATNRSANRPEDSTNTSRSIEQLARVAPKLDKKELEQWLKCNQLKPKGETASTKSLREQRSAGKKTTDGLFGICAAGRIWRKDGRDVWYYVPSLLPVRDKSDPLIAEALRLISTVD